MPATEVPTAIAMIPPVDKEDPGTKEVDGDRDSVGDGLAVMLMDGEDTGVSDGDAPADRDAAEEGEREVELVREAERVPGDRVRVLDGAAN